MREFDADTIRKAMFALMIILVLGMLAFLTYLAMASVDKANTNIQKRLDQMESIK